MTVLGQSNTKVRACQCFKRRKIVADANSVFGLRESDVKTVKKVKCALSV